MTLAVAIVDDSAICRVRLREIVEADEDLHVVVERSSGHEVVAALSQSAARVLLVDLVMPEVDGLAVVRAVMREHPIPIIVVSAGGFDDVSAFEAVRVGALEVATKPHWGDHQAEAALRTAIRRVADVPVIRHIGRVAKGPPMHGTVAGERGDTVLRVLGVGASAGGPPAIVELLEALPPAEAPPVLVAQHMPRDHAGTFARFLAQRCRLEVSVCDGTVELRRGCVYVPDDGRDLVMVGPDHVGIRVSDAPLVPGVDPLFESIARYARSAGGGVILSGIGRDGATGMAAIRAAGGLAMVQDEASCRVYGMPSAAAPLAQFQGSPRSIAGFVTGAGSSVRLRAENP